MEDTWFACITIGKEILTNGINSANEQWSHTYLLGKKILINTFRSEINPINLLRDYASTTCTINNHHKSTVRNI